MAEDKSGEERGPGIFGADGLGLTELQVDALAELFNVGIGRAAAALSRMVSEGVFLNVPTVRFVSRREAARLLAADDFTYEICCVKQRLEGNFDAEAMLIFPQAKSLELVRLMLGESIPLEDLTSMEQEALSEIGNIILNACIGTLSNLLDEDFEISLPLLLLGTCDEILQVEAKGEDEVVMLLYIDFMLERHSIRGHVVFLQNVQSVRTFLRSVQKFVASAGGG